MFLGRKGKVGIPAATGISEVEQILQQKTFTRSEIERLTTLLHSRTNESFSADVVERVGAIQCSSTSSLLRLEASTSGSLKNIEMRGIIYMLLFPRPLALQELMNIHFCTPVMGQAHKVESTSIWSFGWKIQLKRSMHEHTCFGMMRTLRSFCPTVQNRLLTRI
ncbi:hypothetical protein CTI12_AA548840 [Artemisia annua]|uniref:Uncharacterized protein n=1 Tax=Artemisia annua TaxID=35608 RepID=A0A2U1KUB2_ARTAN|nr:hypothetical protein CTI12_AA548840 [Artemisia annua]